MGFCKALPKTLFASLVLSMGLCNNSDASWCCSPRYAWGSVEYLYWWAQDSSVNVPLITQGTPASQGVLNQPGTEVIFGAGSNNNSFKFGGISGARMTIGGWIDDCYQYGLEGSGFGLSRAIQSFSASSLDGTVTIPFFSTITGTESSIAALGVTGFPNTISADDDFQTWGFELNGLYNLSCQAHFPLTLLAGVRYLNISEDLGLNDTIYSSDPQLSGVINLNDDFTTKNSFYGFQVGARTNYFYRNFLFDVAAKIAFGENYQKLSISGQSRLDGVPLLSIGGLPGGIFAQPSNSGTFYNHQFAVLPELQAKVSYNLTQNIQPFLAYNFLYINNIIRSGEQIDRNINLNQPNPPPTASFNTTGMWIQGISLGIAFNI